MPDTQTFTVAALYKFTPFSEPDALRDPLFAICDTNGVRGTLLLAREGINGTIAGTPQAIEAVLDHILSLPGCRDLEVKFSTAAQMPFIRLKVRVKSEIVTMGEPDIDPRKSVGRYIAPEDWNALISDPDTLVIDTRNDYETAIGTFEGAIDPHTPSFRDFPAWFRDNRDDLLAGKKRVAMFCTGGIRCEKSTSFLRAEGVEDVFHLEGGILKYLETIPEAESLWQGECFVFDERVSVGHGLQQGNYSLCRACRRPLSEDDRAAKQFVVGVSCPHCIDERDEKQRARYSERQKQQQIARKRGVEHVGARLPKRR